MDNPDEAFIVMQKLGFELSTNKQRLIFKGKINCTLGIAGIYALDNFSSQLFDLAWNQCGLRQEAMKKLNCTYHYKDEASQHCIFAYDCRMIESQKASFKMLESALIELPYQHNCFAVYYSGNGTLYWILNNNGKKYQNIDWENMDLNKLMLRQIVAIHL